MSVKQIVSGLYAIPHGLFRVGARFVVIWFASGVIAWWLFPRLFWVSFQGLMLMQSVLISYLMAWSMQFNVGSTPAKHAIIIGTLAAPFGLLLNLAVLSINMSSRTPVTSAQSVPGSGFMALLAPIVVGLTILVLGLIGSAIGVMFTRLPGRKEQGNPKVAIMLKIALGILGPVLLILFVRGGPGENTFEARTSTRLSKQDAGRTVEVDSNTQFDIVLDGYPTQDYEWEWIEADWNIVGGGASNYRRDWGGGGGQYPENGAGGSIERTLTFYRCSDTFCPIFILVTPSPTSSTTLTKSYPGAKEGVSFTSG